MRKASAGLTLVEVLVVVGVLTVALVLALVFAVELSRARKQARRSSCMGNLANIVKCCHLYADAVPNLGMFPVYGSDPDANGLKALNLLWDDYVKDHRVFLCPSANTNRGITQRTDLITKSSGSPWSVQSYANMGPSHTAYGYDPGHKPTNPRAGVVADMSDDATKNSPNHGSDRPGQNVGTSPGSVEWLDSATRQRASLDWGLSDPSLKSDDGIYQYDGLSADYETWLIQ
jgi:hypothetical protein